MPRKATGLTARQVQTQKVPGLFADGGGLYLQVAPTGAKTWIFRFQIAGRRRDMGLGSVAVFSLAEARQKEASVRLPALVKLIQERFGMSVHPRSIERSLLHHQKNGAEGAARCVGQ